MKLVIVGAGEVGSYLSSLLSEKKHDVTVIEYAEAAALRVDEEFNVRVVRGNGGSAETLKRAEVGECDFFLAMTSDDKTNLIACSLAKAMGAAVTICRIHDQTYTDTSYVNYQMHFGIDHLINPEALCAVELAKAIRNPGRVAVENFARGTVEVQQVKVSPQSKLLGKPLKELKLPRRARIGYVQHGEVNDVPTADTKLEEGDRVTLFGPPEDVFNLRAKLEPDRAQSSLRVVLFGGGETAIALVRLLTNPRFQIRIIETSSTQCHTLAERFSHVTIIQGDATSLRLMEEEQVGNSDYFVATTKDDENNIVTGLQAAKLGAAHVQAVINKTDYDEVLDSLKEALGVELIVSPRIVTANEVLRLISTASFVELGRLPDNGGVIVEIRVTPDSPAAGLTLRDIDWPPHCQVCAIQHKFETQVPGPEDTILAGDRAVIITREDNIKALLRLLRK